MAKKAAAAERKRRLAGKHLRELALGKKHYNEADQALDQLLAEGLEPGEVISLRGGDFELVDQFVDPKTGEARNKAFRPAGIQRFVLKERKQRD